MKSRDESSSQRIEESESVQKKEYEWKGVAPYEFNVNSDKIQNVLIMMSDLTAAELPEQTFEGTGLEKNSLIVQATGEGIDNTIMIGDLFVPQAEHLEEVKTQAQTELYYAKKGDSDNIYLITKEQKDILNNRIIDLQ